MDILGLARRGQLKQEEQKSQIQLFEDSTFEKTFLFSLDVIKWGLFNLSNGASIAIYIYDLHEGNVKLFFKNNTYLCEWTASFPFLFETKNNIIM